MPEVDEYGIPIKKTSAPVDEYGIPIRTKEVVVEKFGPLPAKTTIAQELPSFQQQQEQVRAPLKYGQAAARDRSETGKLLATTWNNFVGGAESLLAGTIARAGGAKPFGGVSDLAAQAISGKSKTMGETIKEFQEAPKKQAEFEKEAFNKIGELTGVIKSEYATPEEQQQISEIDFTNKSFSDNAKALIASGGRLAFDIPVGAMTGGYSYYLQSYGESVRDYDKMVEKGQLEANPLAREFYGNTVGLVSAALEKFAIDKIFGTGPALKNIQKKAIANVFGKIAKSTTPLSAKATEKLVEAEIRALSASIKSRGAKTVYSAAVEGGTEGLQTAMTEGAKIITNKIQGQEVYDEKEIVDNIGKNIFNASVAGGIYGVPMGAVASFGKNVNSSVLKDIANAKTDEDFAKIDNDLEEVFVANNYSPEEREAVATITKNYARIKQKLPPLTPPEVQEKVIPLIEQRDKIDEELTAKKENASNLDEAVVADETADIEMLEAKRASINDEIRSEVAGTEFKYFEQDGKFFKQLGENPAEEIPKSRYDIESIRQEDKQLAQDEEDAPTVLDMMDKPVIINGERATLSQEGQTVIAKVVGKPRIIEVGNIDEIGNQKLSDVGLTQEESAVALSDEGNVVVRGVEFVNLFTDPLAAINRDANGNVVSVNLETADGKKRTFRGATADDVAYQITLKKITEDNETRQQFEDFVESNESIKQELESGQVAEAPVEAAPVVAEQVPVVAEEEVVPANEVERLRAEEQKELLAAIPNIEEYKVNGVVDRNKITNEEDKKKFDEIYNKYDNLITPLLKAEQPVAEVQPVAGEVSIGAASEEFPKPFRATDSDAIIHYGKVGDRRGNVGEPLEVLEEIPINELIPDQFADISQENVEKYANLETEIPPIEVHRDGDENAVYDGNTRLLAAKKRGQKTIKAWVATVGKDGTFIKVKEPIKETVQEAPLEEPIATEIPKEPSAFVPLEGFDGFEVKGKEEKKERYYNPDRALAMSTIRQKNRAEQDAIIDEIGEPRDARQVAMIALMGKPNISYESYIKETGFGQGEVKTRRGKQTEVAASPFTRKEGNTVEGVAEFWWDNLPEELRDRMDSQDIRNEIIDLLSTYKDQNEIRDAYIEAYAPKELTDEEAMQYFSRYEEEINPIEKEWEEWAAERGEKEMALELDENYVNKLIEQYESTTKAVEPAAGKEKGAGKETGVADATKEAGVAEGGVAKVFEQPIVEQVTKQESEDFTKFVNGRFASPKFEQQYQAEKTTAFGFTETREQFVARKFC